MISAAGDLARRLARDAEAVCRHYLSNGRRSGRYWIVGDVMNTPGRSLYVRLTGPDYGPGAAGKWTDAAATEEHGDLLDLIRLNRELPRPARGDGRGEAFPCSPATRANTKANPAPSNSPNAARRLFRAGRPIPGTQAEAYLRARGITGRLDWVALRFHPRVWYRETDKAPLEAWPALLAAVTDPGGRITGIQRTWLDRSRPDKAPIANPRRALGHLLGNGVRFGAASLPRASGSLIAGEGIETMLALKSVLPMLPMIAALSANHLAALDLSPTPGSIPAGLRRSMSPATTTRPAAGRRSGCTNAGRPPGSKSATLVPVYGDFNVDLCRLGAEGMLAHLADQLVPSDRTSFLPDIAASIRGGETHCHFGSFGATPEGEAAFVGGDGVPWPEKEPRMRPSRAAICRSRNGLAMAAADHFPPPGTARLCSAKQNARRPPSSAVAAALRVRPRSVPGQGIAVKAAIGAADPPAERHPPWHATTAPSPSSTRTIRTPSGTPPRRPRICSTSWHSMAIAPVRTNPIRGHCPNPMPCRPSSTTRSKR